MDAEDGVEPSITLLQRVVLPFDHPALAIPASFYFAAARIAFIIRWAKHSRESADATGFLHAFALHLVVKFHHVWVIHIPMAEVVVVVVHNLGFVTVALFANYAPVVWVAPFPDFVFLAVLCAALVTGYHFTREAVKCSFVYLFLHNATSITDFSIKSSIFDPLVILSIRIPTFLPCAFQDFHRFSQDARDVIAVAPFGADILDDIR